MSNARDTPLTISIYNRHTEMIKLLLACGADPNYRNGSPLEIVRKCICDSNLRQDLEKSFD